MRYQRSSFSLRHKVARCAWSAIWLVLYRPSPRVFHAWRRFLLRIFGSKIGRGAHPYPSARVWAPWNLEMGIDSALGDGVDCYCVGLIRIGKGAVVSQYAFLCSATHD